MKNVWNMLMVYAAFIVSLGTIGYLTVVGAIAGGLYFATLERDECDGILLQFGWSIFGSFLGLLLPGLFLIGQETIGDLAEGEVVSALGSGLPVLLFLLITACLFGPATYIAASLTRQATTIFQEFD